MPGNNKFRHKRESGVNRGNNPKSGSGGRCRREGGCRKTNIGTFGNGFQIRKRSRGFDMTRMDREKGQV